MSHLVAADLGHAEALRGTRSAAPRPTASVMGGVPASNLAGSSARGEPVEADVGDHVAAAEERRHRVEQLVAAPQHADARGAAQLVAGEREEVGAPRLHVGDVVRHVLAAVDDGDRAGGVRGLGTAAAPA